MAIDFNAIDKKKILILGGAVLAGLIAVVLMNNYIKENVETKLSDVAGKTDKQVRELTQQLAQTQKTAQENIQRLYTAQEQLQQKMATIPPPAPPKPVELPVSSLAASMPGGKRAITVNIEVLNAVGGLIRPGDFVDVIAHLTKPAGTYNPGESDKVIVTLFQNVRILAIGQNIGGGQFLPPGVGGQTPITFALNPNEASLLTYVQRQGTLQLVLRPAKEADAYVLPTVSWEALNEYMRTTQGIDLEKGIVKKKGEPEKVTPKPMDIQIFKGGQEVRR